MAGTTNTDVSNKNSSFFAALDKATEVSSKEQETTNTMGAMMVSKEQIQAQADKTIEENQAIKVINDVVKPKEEIETSCHQDGFHHAECLKDFFNYLQDLGVIEVKEEFSITDEFEAFKNAIENIEPIKDEEPEKEPDEIIEDFKAKDFSDEDTYADIVEDYAQAVAETVVSFNENFSSIESLGNFYNNDYMKVLNSEFDNVLRACIELEVPEDMEDSVTDRAISIIAGEPEFDDLSLEYEYLEPLTEDLTEVY